MKKLFTFFISLICLLLSACHNTSDENTIRIGTIAGPETQLMEIAKKIAKKRYGLNIKIVTFSDYAMPNIALNDGSIDANLFQHLPYLEAQKKIHNFKITSIGKVFIYPVGIYSKKYPSLDKLPIGATVAIPNDPSNGARALLLLRKANLIELKPDSGINANLQEVTANPKKLEFKELDAAQLARSLGDVDIAVINTNYAVLANLYPSKNALFTEGKDSPYANIVVVRTNEANEAKYKKLMTALHSPEVLAAAKKLFKNEAIPAWDTTESSHPTE